MVSLDPPSSSPNFCNGLSFSNAPLTFKAQVRIVSVGVAGLDFVANVDHFPEPDEKMRSNSLLVDGGGNAANTACAIANLAPYVSDSTLVTALGNDSNRKTIIDGLTKMNVDVVSDTYEGNSPFTYIITTNDEKNGGNTRTCIHQRGTEELSVDFVTKITKKIDEKNNFDSSNLLENCTAVHFDARYPKAAMALAKKCLELGIPYSIDVERPREGLDELMKGATIIVCNSKYCNIIENSKDEVIENTHKTLRRLYRVMKKQAPRAKLVVQTLGAKGSCLVRLDSNKNDAFDSSKDDATEGSENTDDNLNDYVVLLREENNDSMNKFPGVPTVTAFRSDESTNISNALLCSTFTNCSVVDTTGAGDAFIGGFLTAIWSYCQNATIMTSSLYDKKMNEDNNKQQERGRGEEILSNISDKILARALKIATRVATKKIEKPGARSGLPCVTNDFFLQSEFQAMHQSINSNWEKGKRLN